MDSKKQKTFILMKELERRILYGLVCEWETANLILDPPNRHLMHPPLFNLKDMKHQWGYWSSEKHEISLSKELVLNHSWDSVREVLLHEMAHQYADIVLYANNELPHGPLFQKACHLLRANPKASGCYPPLDERISSPIPGDEDKILIKVNKLMALAESKNQHEAEAAMAKAHKLIVKYNLDILKHKEDRNFISIFLGKPASRHTRADYLLAHILQDFYFVQGIWVPAYVLEKGKMGRVLEISGSIRNVQMASYVHDFVQRFINLQWKDYNKDKGLNHQKRIDFAFGILEGFRSKLAAEKGALKRDMSELALVKIKDALLEKYFHYRYPRTSKFKRGIYTRDENVMKDGKRIGKGLVISKGINETRAQKGLLIGNKMTMT